TLALMRVLAESGELEHLTAERIWQEFACALMENNPEVFIEVLRECGALKVLLPEVDALFGVPQPEQHHPEIDTGIHILSVLQQCVRFAQPLNVRWACLLHDLGKGTTDPAEWPRHIGHETRGLALIKKVNKRFKVPNDCAQLAFLVGEFHTHAHRALELRPSTLLKLLMKFDIMRRPQRLADFIAACEMDSRCRLGLDDRDYPQAEYLREAADVVRAVDVKPLLAQGLQGAELGKALNEARQQAVQNYVAEQ